MKAAPNRIAEFKPREQPSLPLFTMRDLTEREQRVKSDCELQHRMSVGGSFVLGWLCGIAFTALVIKLFPL